MWVEVQKVFATLYFISHNVVLLFQRKSVDARKKLRKTRRCLSVSRRPVKLATHRAAFPAWTTTPHTVARQQRHCVAPARMMLVAEALTATLNVRTAVAVIVSNRAVHVKAQTNLSLRVATKLSQIQQKERKQSERRVHRHRLVALALVIQTRTARTLTAARRRRQQRPTRDQTRRPSAQTLTNALQTRDSKRRLGPTPRKRAVPTARSGRKTLTETGNDRSVAQVVTSTQADESGHAPARRQVSIETNHDVRTAVTRTNQDRRIGADEVASVALDPLMSVTVMNGDDDARKIASTRCVKETRKCSIDAAVVTIVTGAVVSEEAAASRADTTDRRRGVVIPTRTDSGTNDRPIRTPTIGAVRRKRNAIEPP